jgi:hypothetical protein
MLALAVGAVTALQPSVPLGATHFDWPAGTSARVETEFVHEFSDGQRIGITSLLRMTHRMRTLPHAEGRSIEYDNQAYVESVGNLEPAVTALLPLWVPSQVVSRDGRFIRIENADRIQQQVIALFEAKGRNELARSSPIFQEYIRVMTSPAGLEGIAADNWFDLVERWIAAPVTPGPLEGVGPQRIPIQRQRPSTISRRIVGHTPCQRMDTIHECVTYEIAEQRNREQLANFAKSLRAGAPAAANMEFIEETKVEQVTLEPETMLPHDYMVTRTALASTEENGLTVAKINVERIHSVFVYPTEP